MRQAFALALALFVVLPTSAHAQKKKPKRPKKPKTEQPSPAPKKPRDGIPRSPDSPDVTPREGPDREAPADERAPREPTQSETNAPGNATARPDAAADRGPEATPRPTGSTSRPILLGAYGGYASENYRIGFGARGGYSLHDTIYLGAAFTYQLGVIVAGIKYAGFYPALEGGYDWRFQGFTLRPYAGLGLFFARTSGVGAVATGGGWSAFYPGLSLDYQIASTPAFVGVDTRVLFVLGGDRGSTSLGLFAIGGLRL